MPTIDLTNQEHASATAAIRRAIEEDRFPRALVSVAAIRPIVIISEKGVSITPLPS
jgi:hypothetical protein